MSRQDIAEDVGRGKRVPAVVKTSVTRLTSDSLRTTVSVMPTTSTPPPPGDLTRYLATAHAREAERQSALVAHRARALAVAHLAADALKASFGARRVVLFGSLARGGPVSWRSDVDLAAWDVPADRYFVAVGRLQAIDSAVAVDLVRAEDAPLALLSVIDAEGVEL